MAPRVTTTLVTGASGREREQAILADLHQNGASDGGVSAVILEGLPTGQPVLHPSSSLLIERIAPGCLCCAGNLVLRVTLNRLLRRMPSVSGTSVSGTSRLYIGMANAEHLGQLRSWLGSAPYDQLLELAPDTNS